MSSFPSHTIQVLGIDIIQLHNYFSASFEVDVIEAIPAIVNLSVNV